MRDYLKPQFWKLEETEVPGLVFMDRCRGEGGPIEAMIKYRKKEDSDQPEEGPYKEVVDGPRYWCSKIPLFVDRRLFAKEGERDAIPTSPYTGR